MHQSRRGPKATRRVVVVHRSGGGWTVALLLAIVLAGGGGAWFLFGQASGAPSKPVETSKVAARPTGAETRESSEGRATAPDRGASDAPASPAVVPRSEPSKTPEKSPGEEENKQEELRLFEKVKASANEKCLACGGGGKYPGPRILRQKELECLFCKGSGKPARAVRIWMAPDLVEARKNRTLSLDASEHLIYGKVKAGGMSGNGQGWLEFQGPGTLHSVHCSFSMMSHPDVADMLDRIAPGDPAMVLAWVFAPEETLRSEGSVYLAECRLLISGK
jgi:hypothetical protein